ncbi:MULTISPECIES: DUF6527 family protein [Rhizobium]|nr:MULTISPECIES: DUF6527 family protein [Rhizobium]MBY3081839.1 hypothetical protein [Rhizobium laguerreae]MBY3271394.1 hypothetical protein [Rhizobium laguerreae]MBY3294483.1 hypothetical protein [Rhizobium laguerreae]MBY3327355.1 hypothetical protein [Rhizobium laguerreae]MBY3495659.1 hypothetical protein [Rhizobium laguerreae]
MMRHHLLEHRFVEHIPERLQPGVLYVSTEYATSAHSCCCGCGEEVVTPFTPTDWKMTFDGETVSLRPSIGNWTLKCRSHYVIDRGKVVEAGPWSEKQVEAERRRDRAAKARYYGQPPKVAPAVQPTPAKVQQSLWQRLWAWISGRTAK